MPDGWVGGGVDAVEETLVETVRGEGEASQAGTGGDGATGPAKDVLGKNRGPTVDLSFVSFVSFNLLFKQKRFLYVHSHN
jgi:hypothetical protein